MKKFVASIIIVTCVIACTVSHPTVPEGYKTCVTDADCPGDQVCSFKGVNTYAVCVDVSPFVRFRR